MRISNELTLKWSLWPRPGDGVLGSPFRFRGGWILGVTTPEKLPTKYAYTVGVSAREITYFSPFESAEWLQTRLSNLQIGTLQRLSEMTEIDKGTLSRYFRHERRPSIDCIGPLCQALKTSPEQLLKVLGALPK